MDSGEEYRTRVMAHAPPLTENELWLALDPRAHRECDRLHLCGQNAAWATRQGNVHLCDYHRFLADVERTLVAIQEGAVA